MISIPTYTFSSQVILWSNARPQKKTSRTEIRSLQNWGTDLENLGVSLKDLNPRNELVSHQKADYKNVHQKRWRIQDFPDGEGGANHKSGGHQPNVLANFPQNLLENEEKMTQKEEGALSAASLDLPLSNFM